MRRILLGLCAIGLLGLTSCGDGVSGGDSEEAALTTSYSCVVWCRESRDTCLEECPFNGFVACENTCEKELELCIDIYCRSN